MCFLQLKKNVKEMHVKKISKASNKGLSLEVGLVMVIELVLHAVKWKYC